MQPQNIVKKLKGLDKKKAIRFIILFGSKSKNTATPLSDTDIAAYYDAPAKERFRFRIQALGELPRMK